uniref:NAD(P)-binding domain-containing protein n=1 Tax=Alexandrium monilatum TaxID=311494 RepID=A0A7S4VSU2_9DINO
MAPTVAIIGGTGKTGKWAVKGALVRGYSVRMLGRSPDKVGTILQELFPEKGKEELLKEVTVVQGSVTDQAKLTDLFNGADVILSFLGMVKPPEFVVRPGVEAVMEAMRQCESKPKFVSMSSISIGDSLGQGRSAWGRITVGMVWVFLKSCFKDLEAAEQYIAEHKDGLNVSVIRATILSDKKGFFLDYSKRDSPSYKLVKVEQKAKLTKYVDRQAVAEAFLDVCETSENDGTFISVFGA